MVEGLGISSSRGSFRIAYNASKILSLSTSKGIDGNINSITVKTSANRERGSLDVCLRLDGIKIEGLADNKQRIINAMNTGR